MLLLCSNIFEVQYSGEAAKSLTGINKDFEIQFFIFEFCFFLLENLRGKSKIKLSEANGGT